MDLTILQLVLIFIGGFSAGVMNTLAGYGSLITLSLLMEVIGLPPSMANATNRVNVLCQCTASAWGYHSKGKIDLRSNYWIVFTMLTGAILGVLTVLHVSNEEFRSIFKYLIILLFVVILINPSRWMRQSKGTSTIPLPLRILGFLLLGFYGGFIQMGMGVIFLAMMVLVEKNTLLLSNGLKVAIVAMYTSVVLAIFWYQGLISWQAGLLVATGQTIGGFFTARYASDSPHANRIAYYALVLIVFSVIVYQFALR